MVCLRLEPGAAEWKAQTNPLCYGGTPHPNRLSLTCLLVDRLHRLASGLVRMQREGINF